MIHVAITHVDLEQSNELVAFKAPEFDVFTVFFSGATHPIKPSQCRKLVKCIAIIIYDLILYNMAVKTFSFLSKQAVNYMQIINFLRFVCI